MITSQTMLTASMPPRVDPSAYSTADFSVPQFSELLDKIYHGPLEQTPCSSALRAIRQLLCAKTTTLILRPPSFGRPGMLLNANENGTHSPNLPAYNNYYFSLDPFVHLPRDTVVTADKYFGERAWCESDLYKNFLLDLDIRYVLGADISTADGVECRFRVCRDHQGPDFSPRDEAICAVLLPHLKRAVDLHSRLDVIESERTLYEGTVDRMMLGMAMLDERGAILKINAAAKRLLAESDGMSLKGGLFEFAYGQERNQFRSLLQKVLEPLTVEDRPMPGTIEAMSVTRPSGKAKLGLLIRAIPASEWSEDNKWRPACIVFIRDPEQKSGSSTEMMRKLFHLTPSEAAMALLMANGFSVDEAADEMGVSRHTARAHLRAIFAKTGVTRQAELVRTLLNGVLSLG